MTEESESPISMPDPQMGSPLVQAEPESIDELFSRDPLELTKEDLGKIVSILRAQRASWKLDQQPAKAGGKPKPPAGNITIESLKLEL